MAKQAKQLRERIDAWQQNRSERIQAWFLKRTEPIQAGQREHHKPVQAWQHKHNEQAAFHKRHKEQLEAGTNGTSPLARWERFVYTRGLRLIKSVMK